MLALLAPFPFVACAPAATASGAFAAQDPILRFEKIVLSEEFLCEGASIGDVDGDGDADVVSGPWWYAGPDFATRHPIYEAKPFDPLQYSDHFFSWVRDVDGDGRNDVFAIGFPGQEAAWYRNPGPDAGQWMKFPVFQGVDNESPTLADVDGDGVEDLVCMHEGRLGWASADGDDPAAPWTWHPVSEPGQGGRFAHGLGAGDLNGDGRVDLLLRNGWWEQPPSLDGDPLWDFHPYPFSPSYGGAQMLVHDVDGDGDADVITAREAHGFGLDWLEQRAPGSDPPFTRHVILPVPPEDAPLADHVSELHALAMADLDGDGLQDLITGKRWWSHGPGGERGADDPAMTLALLQRRGADGEVRWERQRIDGDTGVGVDVRAGDVDGDGRVDVVVANKKGTAILRQRPPATLAAQGGNLGFETGQLVGWTAEGRAFRGQPVRGDTVARRRPDMSSHHAGTWWIGGYELLGDAPTGTLTSDSFPARKPWGSFLIGGGAHEDTRVEILREADGQVIYSVSGANDERMQRVVVDLRDFQGQRIRIRLVDEHAGGWGHVNFDDFRFHDERPEVAPPAGVKKVHPYPALQQTGLEPEAAAQAMSVPEGFHVDLIAGEPKLHQPVALHVDARGRLWVAEAHSYPIKRPPDEAEDKIVVFEDRDLDGSYETRTVFADDLNLVSGLITGFGGVWVGAAPELLFIPDADDDLVPDAEPRVVLDGWGYQDTHETLNSFIWGPDGWLYGCHGVFTHSKVGAPGTPAAERVPLNAGVWRFHPQREEFEVFAYGTSNPWGVDFDDRGQAFMTACVIPHLWHAVQGGRYQRQGGRHFHPHPYAEIGTIADHLHYEGNVAEHAWWGRDRAVADPGTDLAGGGHAHCGALVYLGDQFPDEYRNTVLMNNIHGNRMNRDVPARRGSGFVGAHAADFVRANDQWYRGIAMRTGPDGSVYFIDWYDRNACHRTRAEIWDRTNGRLYRVRHGDLDPVEADLRARTDLQLVALQDHPNDWWVRRARQILQERGGSPDVHLALRSQFETTTDTARRLRALWALHVTGGIDDAWSEELLDHADADVRAWAIQLQWEDRAAPASFRARMEALARLDPSPVVRLYLASALQRMPLAQRWGVARALAMRAEDASDPNVPTVLWYGVEPLVAAEPARALDLAAEARIPALRRWIWRRFAAGSDAEREALVRALPGAGAERQAEILHQMLIALRDRPGTDMPGPWLKVSEALLSAPDETVRERAGEVALAFGDRAQAPVFATRLRDASLPPAKREAALDGLVQLGDAQYAADLLAVLDEPALRVPAMRGLAVLPHEEAPKRILGMLDRLGTLELEVAITTLTSRVAYARDFLAAIAAGEASPRLLDAAAVRRQLRGLRDAQVDRLLVSAWGRSEPPDADDEAEIARWKEKLTPEALAAADLPRGRAVYARTCSACHTLWGEGGTLGPDITGANRSDLDYLLANLIAPSAEVGRQYLMTTVRMRDGRVVTGTVQREDERSLQLKTAAGDETLLKRNVERRADGSLAVEHSEMSLMPPGQLQALSDAEARDLIAYLQSERQTPLAATPQTVGSFFNGRDLSGWRADEDLWSVEDGVIVGRALDGLDHNAFAWSELWFEDFRLVVDVMLVGGEGNSGIQIRSVPLEDGEMRGYQADVGPGWWGRLYEESGRGLLEEPAAGVAPKPRGWNRYEIVAVGDRVMTALNGEACVDRSDPEARRDGVTAFQIHSGGPMEVRFRIVRVELNPDPVLTTAD